MGVGRVWVGVVSVGLLSAAALIAAPGGMAASIGDYSAPCVSGASIDDYELTGEIGDTIQVLNTGGRGTCFVTSSSPGVVSWRTTQSSQSFLVNPSSIAIGYAAAVTLESPGTTVLTVQQGDAGVRITITVNAAPLPPATSSIPAWVQAYARSAGESCETGWDPSWELWPNGGVGGFVCTRTVPSLG